MVYRFNWFSFGFAQNKFISTELCALSRPSPVSSSTHLDAPRGSQHSWTSGAAGSAGLESCRTLRGTPASACACAAYGRGNGVIHRGRKPVSRR